MAEIACLDIGGSKVLGGILNEAGAVLATRREPLSSREPRDVAHQAAALLRRLQDQAGVSPSGVGCAIPGPLDRRTGMVVLSPNLGWRNIPFAAILSEACRLPVALDDDARCAAIGEWWRGERQHVECILFIVVGTGIGGALIMHDQPVYGATDNAGEIGHTVVLVDGPRCSCGKRGCLEAVASGWALAEAGRTSARSGHAPELLALAGGSADAVSVDHVLRAARRGSPAAQAILENAGAMLGLAIANAVTLLNPQLVIIGGGVGLAAFDVVHPSIRKALLCHALAPAAQAVTIAPSSLGDHAGLVGACRVFLQAHPAQSG
jgi:glucokinase